MSFDFDAVSAPFRMQPGLRRVATGAAQLTPNEVGSAHLRAKCAVLREQAGDALLATPGFDPRPVFEALTAEADRDGSQALRFEGDGRLAAPRLGWSVGGDDEVRGDGPDELGACLRALPPARRAAGLASLAFAEDFAVVEAADARVPWLAVCLPSHWSPAEKIGRRMAEIHAPVADNAVLLAASEALARLVTDGGRWERFVWTLTPRAALDAHPQRLVPTAWPVDTSLAALASATFFRTEHQTFLPLPGAVPRALFTIRIDVAPLADAIDSPDRARRLHAALSSMSDTVVAYRGLAPVRGRLLAWLACRAG